MKKEIYKFKPRVREPKKNKEDKQSFSKSMVDWLYWRSIANQRTVGL